MYQINLSTLLLNKFALLIAIFITSCGYKPVSHFAKENIQTAYVHVKLHPKYPENYVVSKNKLISLLSEKLGVKVFDDKKKAKTHITMEIIDIHFNPVEYRGGFISKYRSVISVEFTYKTSKNKKNKTKIIKTYYDFTARESTLYTKLQRDEKSLSVDEASKVAIEKFIASIII